MALADGPPRLGPEERRAARFLELVYAAAEATGQQWRHGWIAPDEGNELQRSLLGRAFPSHAMFRAVAPAERAAWYGEAVAAFVPVLRDAATYHALTTVNAQEHAVGQIGLAVTADAAGLHRAAGRVRTAAENWFLTRSMTSAQHKEVTGQSGRGGGSMPERLDRMRYRLAAKDGESGHPVLARLMVHPKGVAMIDALAASQTEGARQVAEVLADTEEALRGLRAKLTEPEMVWRLPAAVAGGVRVLGLHDRPALAGFALAWAHHAGQSSLDAALEIAGNALMALELMGGPAGALAAEVIDLVLVLIGASAAVLRELEQDQAAEATAFAADGTSLSPGGNVLGAALSGAVAFGVSLAAPVVVSRMSRRVVKSPLLAADPGKLPDPREVLDARETRIDPRGVQARGVDNPAVTAQDRGLSGRKVTEPDLDKQPPLDAPGTAKTSVTEPGLGKRTPVVEPDTGRAKVTEPGSGGPAPRQDFADPAQLDWSDFADDAPKEIPDHIVEPAGLVIRGPGDSVLSPEELAGFRPEAVEAFKRLLGKPLSSSELGALWQPRAANIQRLLAGKDARYLFDLERPRFWRRVQLLAGVGAPERVSQKVAEKAARMSRRVALPADQIQAVKELLERTGLRFDGDERTAPFWAGGGRRIVMTIDHADELQTVPGLALDSANLRIVFWLENTWLIKEVNRLDAFQPANLAKLPPVPAEYVHNPPVRTQR